MSNTTKNKLSGIAPITIDTEVTQTGEYPVEGKGIYAYVNANKGMTNPMTASGDIIYGGSSGAPTRLAKGSNGQVLTLESGVPKWKNAPASSFNMTLIASEYSDEMSAIVLWRPTSVGQTFEQFIAGFTEDAPYIGVYGTLFGSNPERDPVVGVYSVAGTLMYKTGGQNFGYCAAGITVTI